jgi:hypothetical protein
MLPTDPTFNYYAPPTHQPPATSTSRRIQYGAPPPSATLPTSAPPPTLPAPPTPIANHTFQLSDIPGYADFTITDTDLGPRVHADSYTRGTKPVAYPDGIYKISDNDLDRFRRGNVDPAALDRLATVEFTVNAGQVANPRQVVFTNITDLRLLLGVHLDPRAIPRNSTEVKTLHFDNFGTNALVVLGPRPSFNTHSASYTTVADLPSNFCTFTSDVNKFHIDEFNHKGNPISPMCFCAQSFKNLGHELSFVLKQSGEWMGTFSVTHSHRCSIAHKHHQPPPTLHLTSYPTFVRPLPTTPTTDTNLMVTPDALISGPIPPPTPAFTSNTDHATPPEVNANTLGTVVVANQPIKAGPVKRKRSGPASSHAKP